MPAVISPIREAKHLIVRLRNWVGDVVLGVPALRVLQEHGYRLHLVGRPWARELLKGEGWNFEPLAPTWHGRISQLRHLRNQCRLEDPHFDTRHLNSLALPFSFSSAMEMRLAGLRCLGYSYEGRSILLSKAPPRPAGLHELESYWQLASMLLPEAGHKREAPKAIELQVSPEHDLAAQSLRLAHQLSSGYIVLCPFAGGTFSKQSKEWPGFPLLAQRLQEANKTLLICPGPGEEDVAKRDYPGCIVLFGINLGTYAALIKQAALMISNDTGPGHIAAAVGTKIVSILGPTDAAQWSPWGPQVHVIQGVGNQWPEPKAVLTAAMNIL